MLLLQLVQGDLNFLEGISEVNFFFLFKVCSRLFHSTVCYRNLGHKKRRRKMKDEHDFMRSTSEPSDRQAEQLKLRIPRITR